MNQENINVSRVRRILDKLQQVRARKLSCYGSDGHHFRLQPPLPEADVQAFETKHQIRLPEDYRAFLTHAGNGGAGPYCGLFPLAEWNDFADWVEDERPDNFLALPCPLYRGMPRTSDWREHFGDVSPYQGTLSLGSRGCAFATQLIVSGSYAGRVVYVDADGNEPPYIVHEPDFLSWYEWWLDELLQGHESSWFGYGPSGDEEDFLRILDDPQADEDFKSEAARAFCCLPRLSDEVARRIPAFLDSPIAGVRLGALATAARFELKPCTEHAAQRLDDADANVRRQAIYTIERLDPWHFSEAIRRLLEDSEEDVARTAFYRLQEAGALTKSELLHLIEASPRRSFRSSAVGAVAWGDEDVPLLIRLLRDEDQYVRSSAMWSLRRLQDRDALPHLLDLLSRETVVHIVGGILKVLGEFAEPSTVPVLLEWARCADDFNRLEALDALAKIGDERAVPIAQAMLREERPPVRRDAHGFMSQTHSRTISELVRTSLQQSPNPTLRQLETLNLYQSASADLSCDIS